MDIFSPFEEERKGKVKIIPLRKTLFFPNWMCIWLVRTRTTRTYSILSESALRRHSRLNMKKECYLSMQVTYGLPHFLPWNLKSTPFRIFFEQSSRKKWVKNFFQKTCSIYSTMVPFLVFYERGNINIFIRSILDHFCYLLRAVTRTESISGQYTTCFKICRLKITISILILS